MLELKAARLLNCIHDGLKIKSVLHDMYSNSSRLLHGRKLKYIDTIITSKFRKTPLM